MSTFWIVAIGRKDEAKEFFDDFENSGISIEHYADADWMREDYIFMKAEFEADKASSGNSSSS